MNAELVDLNDKLTIIPVTEKSGSRTAGKEPHPLCDNLRYLAGDYTKYYEDDGICHELYISQLKEWVESGYCHEKVRAIYLYLKKNTLVSDLVKKRIIKLNEQNQIDDKENIQGIVQTKAFVRFIIRSSNTDLSEIIQDECWKDRTLQDCYINYVRSQEKEKGLCYLTGNTEAISYLHSKKIRNEGDGAKLISANDSQNFTYRGRFVSKEDAFAVGNETSQKIHNALKWIIRKQGTFFDTLVVVTWESHRLSMPRWNVDTDTIASEYAGDDDWDDEESEEESACDGNAITAEKFYSALRGYAKKSGLDVDTVILSPMSHAGYYPGGKVMTMKVVFEKETYRLLGAQIIGYEGVDKRIDVLATAIHAGLKATQLKDLDLAYAPPYSSAKDPVNMAGFMIDNIAKGILKQWHLEDMDKISKDKNVVLLDVRTVGEFNRGHMKGFNNIPVDELRERISEIEKGKPVYLICQSGLRSYIASRILEGNGYETYNFSGGFRFYDTVVNDRALIERAYACGMDY